MFPLPEVRRCPEKRAHYAHEFWPSGLTVKCPGGPTEIEVPPGQCWSDRGSLGEVGSFRCELLAGHAGAHQANGGSWCGRVTWMKALEAPTTEENES